MFNTKYNGEQVTDCGIWVIEYEDVDNPENWEVIMQSAFVVYY